MDINNLKSSFVKAFNPPDDFNFRTNYAVKTGIAILTLIIVILCLPSYKDIETQYEVGTIWSREDLIAPFSFPVYKDEVDYENEKKDVVANVAPVFRPAGNINTADTLRNFFTKLDAVLQQAASQQEAGTGDISSPSLDALKSDVNIDLNPQEWSKLFQLYKGELPNESISYSEFKSRFKTGIDRAAGSPVISIPKSEIPTPMISVAVSADNIHELRDVNTVIDRNEAVKQVKQSVTPGITDIDLISAIEEISSRLFKENLIFAKDLTDLEINNRIDKIPKTVGIVRENERIISKHDPINRQTKLKLDSYKKVRLERIGVDDYFMQFLGKALIVFILLVILAFFLYLIRKHIFNDNVLLALIASLIILECFIAYVTMNLTVNAPVELLIFISVASILLTIMFDSRVAFYVSVIICFLIAFVRGGDYAIAFISFCGAVLAIFSVRDIKNRSQIFRSFFFVLVANSIAILAIGFDRMETSEKILNNLLYGGINAIMAPVIAYGLLIFYERVFRITTDLTLLELSDFNHPLLKRLSSQAPGTFHHSIIMGNLCEAAAEAIGANRVLARVGCYYHDIGKVKKPEYYVENQMDRINKHEQLNPNISAKIIISHVKDGIELAKQYNLPQEIIDFIPQHHGTTLVSYFYSKAKTQTDENKEDVSDTVYRYPGPKPQSKETGIAMLADSIEPSTRTIEDPTPQKLETKIIEMIRQRFMEGQLDECDLTLKDLTKIKDAFLKIMVGIHHHRIKYPEDEKTAEEKVTDGASA